MHHPASNVLLFVLLLETPSYVSSRERVEAARNALSDRYCAVLESFRRNHTVISNDRIREYVLVLLWLTNNCVYPYTRVLWNNIVAGDQLCRE